MWIRRTVSGLVADHMTRGPAYLQVGQSAAEALRRMRALGIRHLPILDEAERVVGVLSDRELFLAKRERGIDPDDVMVDELMAGGPYCVEPNQRLEEVAREMAHRRIGCAIVVEHGRLVGILTTTDALRALAEFVAALRGLTHAPHGRVTRLHIEEGYGFLLTADGRELYFDRWCVSGGSLDRLAIGSEVRFTEEPGDEGARAATVDPLGAWPDLPAPH